MQVDNINEELREIWQQITDNSFNPCLQIFDKLDKNEDGRIAEAEMKEIALLLENIEPDLRKLDNKVRFICGIVHGDIIVSNRKRAELLMELRCKNFDPSTKKLKAAKPG
ncbi:unnamed protein product [Urochloa humidicola]